MRGDARLTGLEDDNPHRRVLYARCRHLAQHERGIVDQTTGRRVGAPRMVRQAVGRADDGQAEVVGRVAMEDDDDEAAAPARRHNHLPARLADRECEPDEPQRHRGFFSLLRPLVSLPRVP